MKSIPSDIGGTGVLNKPIVDVMAGVYRVGYID